MVLTVLFLRTMALASSSFSLLADIGAHPKCSVCHAQHLLNITFHSYKYFSKKEHCPYWAHEHVWISAPWTFSAYKSYHRSLFFLGKNKKWHGHVPCSIKAHILRARLTPSVLIRLTIKYSVDNWKFYLVPATARKKICGGLVKMPRKSTYITTYTWVRVKFIFTCADTLDMSPRMVLLFMGCPGRSLYCCLPQSLQVNSEIVHNV